MNKLLATGLAALGITLFNALSIKAQGMVVETQECINAISSVESQLQSDRDLTIEFSEVYNGSMDGTPPEGRPNQYVFGMNGSAVETVMNSGVLLDNLATQIISNCNSISLNHSNNWYELTEAQQDELILENAWQPLEAWNAHEIYEKIESRADSLATR